jgi:3-dehydroquinate synthase class II
MMAQRGSFSMTSGKTSTEREEIFSAVAKQLMSGDEVVISDENTGDQRFRVQRVGRGRLRMVQFRLNGRMFEAIEQNPEKSSRWGQLAREKHKVVQFRDTESQQYVAVSVDGKAREYANKGRDY